VRYLDQLADRIDAQQSVNLFRQRLVVDSARFEQIEVAGDRLINFSSNDYLGLAHHPKLKESVSFATETMGVGSGASHLVTGHQNVHRALELKLAEFTHAESALIFSSGYMANLAVISTLVGRRGAVVADKLNHASLIDGAILSRGKLLRYRHKDLADAESRLVGLKGGADLLVSDSVFSMDGDLADVSGLQSLSEHYDVPLLLDDAHGFGILGEGRGIRAHEKLRDNVIIVGTLGKALGVYGAFVAGPQLLIQALIQFARPYIYTTSIPPSMAAATLKSIELLETEPARLQTLFKNINQFKALAKCRNLPIVESDTPIQPIVVKDSARALRISNELRRRGYLLTAIRPPTVPAGSARLRLTLSAAHSFEQIKSLVEELSIVLNLEL